MLNRFLDQHVHKGALVPELSVRAIVERLIGMSGALCWELVQPAQQLASTASEVEEMALKQIRYEAMPAKCVAMICQVLIKMPPPAATFSPTSASTSASLSACTSVKQVWMGGCCHECKLIGPFLDN